MKAPEYIGIRGSQWYCEPQKSLYDLKKGDEIYLSFGRERSRENKYKVLSASKRIIQLEKIVAAIKVL